VEENTAGSYSRYFSYRGLLNISPIILRSLNFAAVWFFSGVARLLGLSMKAVIPTPVIRTNMAVTVLIAVALFFLDAFVIGSFYVAGIILLLVIPLKLAKAVKLRKEKVLLKQVLIRTGIYGLAAISIIVMFSANNTIAIKRTEMIVDACERYKTKFGDYPSTLATLIPEFLKEIPSAKIGLVAGGFRYISNGGKHQILFVKVPPYGRKYYTLETREWSSID
jgi:hypothetical protein